MRAAFFEEADLGVLPVPVLPVDPPRARPQAAADLGFPRAATSENQAPGYFRESGVAWTSGGGVAQSGSAAKLSPERTVAG